MTAEAKVHEPRGIHRRIIFEVTESLRLRLAANIDRRGDNECWPWKGAIRNGYGAIKHEKKVLGSHVVAYVVHKGELPAGHIVTHDCDNRICCNPNHLKAGTPTTNVVEMFERKRVNQPRGRAAYNAVLDESTVRLIHALRASGISRQKIAALIGRAQGTVKTVIENRSWRHVPKPTADEAKALVAEFSKLNQVA